MINFYDLNIFHLLIYISFIKNILTEIYLLVHNYQYKFNLFNVIQHCNILSSNKLLVDNVINLYSNNYYQYYINEICYILEFFCNYAHYFMHIIMLTFAVNQAVIMNIMRDTRDTMFLKCN